MSGAEGGGGGSFLSRWSRRKRAALAPPPVAPAPAPSEAAAPEAVPPEARPPPARAEPAFDLASLPPVESLTRESDFAAFLRKEVPAVLRNAALRRAWSLDPLIRDFTGPADYAWDFNAPGSMPGFSLDLPSEVESLLAQITGPATPPPDEVPDEGGQPPPAPMLHAESSFPATLALPEDAPVAPPHDRGAEEREPEQTPLAAPSAETPRGSPARRRHGGALPT